MYCAHCIPSVLICICTINKDYYYLCWVTEISPRQVTFVAIMRPPRPNLKIKHEIYYGIESFYSRGAGKLKLCPF